MTGYWAPFFLGAGAATFLCYIGWLAHQFRQADRLLTRVLSDEDYTNELAQAWAEGNTNGLLGYGEDCNPYADLDATEDAA